MLTNNSETWFNLTSKDIKTLESADNQFLRKILFTSSKTTICIMMLELGIPPMHLTNMTKRIIYLHHLLNCSDHSLNKQIFLEQNKTPIKGYWTSTVQEDLEKFKITLSLDSIAN